MANYYKSLADGEIRLNLFGVGEVVVPAKAKSIELDPAVAKAINDLVYPNVVLQEVTPIITIEDEDSVPIAKNKKVKIVTADKELTDEEEPLDE